DGVCVDGAVGAGAAIDRPFGVQLGVKVSLGDVCVGDGTGRADWVHDFGVVHLSTGADTVEGGGWWVDPGGAFCCLSIAYQSPARRPNCRSLIDFICMKGAAHFLSAPHLEKIFLAVNHFTISERRN